MPHLESNGPKVFGPDQEASVNPIKLCEKLRQALEGKGVQFTADAGHEHVLLAAIDFVENDMVSTANRTVLAMSPDEFKKALHTINRQDFVPPPPVPRHLVIATAIEDHRKIPHVTSVQSFVNFMLTESGNTPLTDDELLFIPEIA